MGCCQSQAVTRRRRRSVKPMTVIPAAATKATGENSPTQSNRVTVAPLGSSHPGIVLVREASAESRVDLTHLTGHTALSCPQPCTPAPPLDSTIIALTPESLHPVGQSPALKDDTLQWVQQLPESDSNAVPPPSPARMPAVLSPPSRPQTRVIRRHYSVPAQRESFSSLAVFQHFHTRLSYPGSQRLTLAQQYNWNCPVNVLTPHNVLGPIRPPTPVMRVQYRYDDNFREIQLHNPESSGGGSSDKECADMSYQAHQARPPRRGQRAQKVPRPTAALPSRRRDWARGLYDRFPPEEYNTKRGTYVRGSDDSLSSSSSSSSSFSSLDRELPPRCVSPTPPEIPKGMEIPDDPNILPRPNTRGGVAFEYLLEPGRPQTSMVHRPVSRRSRMRRRRRTRAELDLQQRLAELRRRVSNAGCTSTTNTPGSYISAH